MTHEVDLFQNFHLNSVGHARAGRLLISIVSPELGTHHHIAGKYLNAYAGEAAWREDHRRIDNGNQAAKVGAALMGGGVSRQWAGYWQRAA